MGVDTEDCVDEGTEGEEVGHTPYRVGRGHRRIRQSLTDFGIVVTYMSGFPNWFQTIESNFRHVFPVPVETEFHALQLGVFTGDASLWIAENLLRHPDSTLTDVDTWQGSDETPHHELDFGKVEAFYDARLAPWLSTATVEKNKMTTREWFRSFPTITDAFDLIYIDADHTAAGVLEDAVNAHSLLKSGGVLAFDDYGWTSGIGVHEEPRLGIDAFLAVYGNKYETIGVGWQVWLRKL